MKVLFLLRHFNQGLFNEKQTTQLRYHISGLRKEGMKQRQIADENTNGRMRQLWTKKFDFAILKEEQIDDEIMNLLREPNNAY